MQGLNNSTVDRTLAAATSGTFTGDHSNLETDEATPRVDNNWQPIETAPKDGTTVILWTPDGIDIGEFEQEKEDGLQYMGHDAGWVSHGYQPTLQGRSFGNIEYRRTADNQPTHWMPLPPPPEVG